MMRITESITTLCLVFVVLLNLALSSPVRSEGKKTNVLSRNRRQIWGGSYDMIFGREQCHEQPCLIDGECCRGFSCFNPKELMLSRHGRSMGVCLDDVDIRKFEATMFS